MGFGERLSDLVERVLILSSQYRKKREKEKNTVQQHSKLASNVSWL
jgi:hypothetical protein